MFNILTLNEISKKGLDLLSDNYSHSFNIQRPDAILVRSAKIKPSEISENLLAIARAGVGTNNIPIDFCTNNGIVVFNTPGANANAVNELVIAGIILSSRKISKGIEWVKSLKGEKNIPNLVEKYKSIFSGPEIKGKKIGIAGLGAIGKLVANSALNLGMQVFVFDPFVEKVDLNLSQPIQKIDSLEQLFSTCDYISLHIPYSDITHHMINESILEKAKPNIRLLNFSRGEIVDNQAILKFLKEKKLAGYVTDFPQSELIDVENVIAIPHLGASTPESEQNCAIMAVRQLVDYIEHGNIENSVNFPSVKMEISGPIRVCILHKNIPGMMNKISGLISSCEINIENIICKTKDAVSYSILDIDRHLPLSALSGLKNLSGLIRIRVIG